jgi:hypothetical protein
MDIPAAKRENEERCGKLGLKPGGVWTTVFQTIFVFYHE